MRQFLGFYNPSDGAHAHVDQESHTRCLTSLEILLSGIVKFVKRNGKYGPDRPSDIPQSLYLDAIFPWCLKRDLARLLAPIFAVWPPELSLPASSSPIDAPFWQHDQELLFGIMLFPE
jgi:hypothetical protein